MYQQRTAVQRIGLDVRTSAVLTNTPATGRYRTALERNVRRGTRLSRADLAHFMLRTLVRPETVGNAIAVAY